MRSTWFAYHTLPQNHKHARRQRIHLLSMLHPCHRIQAGLPNFALDWVATPRYLSKWYDNMMFLRRKWFQLFTLDLNFSLFHPPQQQQQKGSPPILVHNTIYSTWRQLRFLYPTTFLPPLYLLLVPPSNISGDLILFRFSLSLCLSFDVSLALGRLLFATFRQSPNQHHHPFIPKMCVSLHTLNRHWHSFGAVCTLQRTNICARIPKTHPQHNNGVIIKLWGLVFGVTADVVVFVGCCRLNSAKSTSMTTCLNRYILWVVIQTAVAEEELQSLFLLFTGTLEIPPRNHKGSSSSFHIREYICIKRIEPL